MPRKESRKIKLHLVPVVLVAVVALIAQLIGVWASWHLGKVSNASYSSDFTSFYDPLAIRIANGKGLRWDNGQLAVRYPPGHPIFLAGNYVLARSLGVDRRQFVVYVNVALGVITCLGIYCLGTNMFNQRVGSLGALGYALYPFFIWLSREPHSEPPFIFLYVWSLVVVWYSFSRGHVWIVSLGGIGLGIATLVRPISQFLPFLLALFAITTLKSLSFARRIVVAGVLVVAYLLTLSPWLLYASTASGSFIPVSTSGIPANMDGMVRFPGNKVSEAALANATQIKKSVHSLARFHWEQMRSNTADYVVLWIRKVLRAWYATDAGWMQKLILVIQIPVLFLGGWGIINMGRYSEFRSQFWFLLVNIFYFWAMTTAALSILRYMVPVMFCLILFAAWWISAQLQVYGK